MITTMIILIKQYMMMLRHIQDKRKEAQQKNTYKSCAHKQASCDIGGADGMETGLTSLSLLLIFAVDICCFVA